MISSIYCTTAVVALLIWALAKQGGGGPLLYDTVKTTGVPKLKGSKLAWTMARSVTTTVGGWSAAVRPDTHYLVWSIVRPSADDIPRDLACFSQIMYQSDFTRYARRPGDQRSSHLHPLQAVERSLTGSALTYPVYGQVFVIPIAMLITSFLGVIITSCAAGFYPEDGLLWCVSSPLRCRSCSDPSMLMSWYPRQTLQETVQADGGHPTPSRQLARIKGGRLLPRPVVLLESALCERMSSTAPPSDSSTRLNADGPRLCPVYFV